MTNDELAEWLEGEFLVRGYEWKFDDGPRPPYKADFLEAFEELKRTTPEGSFQVVGRLVAINDGGHFDIYMQVGEI